MAGLAPRIQSIGLGFVQHQPWTSLHRDCVLNSAREPFRSQVHMRGTLPPEIRSAENIDSFKRKLKTHLFSLAFNLPL
jgi:hypothetical protein